MSSPSLHSAEHRGYRELYVAARQLRGHWSTLADRAGPGEAADALRSGAGKAGELLDELPGTIAPYGLHVGPAAGGLGRRLAGMRNQMVDRFLERNQALRLAATAGAHITLLLAFLQAVAAARGDEALVTFTGRWERKLRRAENAVRKAAAESGANPDAAVEPVDTSALGRLAHGAAYGTGAVGEWVDRRSAGGA